MFLIKNFVASNVHLGHKINKWNPLTSKYLLGKRDDIYIIDLEQTIIMMRRALTFIKKICLRRGYIFYVPSVLGSVNNQTFTNSSAVSHKSLDRKFSSRFFGASRAELSKTLFETNKVRQIRGIAQNLIILYPELSSFFSKSTSKQRGTLYAFIQKRQNLATMSEDGDIIKNGANFNCLNLFLKPETLVVIQTDSNKSLIKESIKLQIPIVGILDSNSNSFGIQYPIPGNDNSLEAHNLYTELLLNAVIDAKNLEAKQIV